MRLNKFIGETGLCSRREADQLIQDGRVTVNGERAVLGVQVTEEDAVCVDGRRIGAKRRPIYLALNKPVGITCTTRSSGTRNVSFPSAGWTKTPRV